ncbi:acyltransferase family protein [Amycolatopsis anabasis]|uniref:acyltransferase family protein n=1 Tax=Amycolatopsis anabasis TaxID=1840409 RepID=UPI00131DA514|nr:acyltransferase [Amycolatopsis anabasis]
MNNISDGGGRARERTRRFFPELEGLRGFAAIMVLLSHVAISTGQVGWAGQPAPDGLTGAVLNKMEVGLPIFFVLSGALLYRPFALATLGGAAKPAARPYFWRRALRILPAYWLLCAVALPLLNGDRIDGAWQVLRPLLLLHVYEQDGTFAGAALPAGLEQTWSLSTEVAFYLTLPLLAGLLGWFARGVDDPARRMRRIVLPLGAAVLAGFGAVAYTHLPARGPFPVEHLWPLEYVGFFAVGMALATLSAGAELFPGAVPRPYRLVAGHPVRCWLAALAVFVMLCLSPVGEPASSEYPAVDAALVDQALHQLFTLLLVAPLTVPGARSRLVEAVLANPVSRFLGRISYGVFLWHLLVFYVWHGSLFGATGFWKALAVVLAGSVTAGTLSFQLVERPFMRLRPLLGRAPAKPSVVTTTR